MKIILLIFLFTISALAIPLNKQTLMDISKTYGYYVGQTYTLDKIKEKYPKLSNQIFIAKTEFDLSFSNSIKNIDMLMSKYDGWKSIKGDMIKNIHTKLDISSPTYNESIEFIETVKQRAKGNIETPVIETLLMLNPKYEEKPEREFYDGFKKKYISDNLQKSKGIEFSLEVPMSWISKEANRPNIVRKFISNNGHSIEMAMVLVYEFPDGKYLTESDIKSTVNKKDMNEAIPPDSILKDFGYMKLETLPGYWQRYSMKVQRVRKVITIEILAYTIFYKDKLIQIQFQIGDFEDTNLDKRFKKFEPLFDSIINSFVLTSLYKK
ncbi:hypothetical protein [Sulfurimonas sp. CS5]|uniref:hypothetical protein n=1 Tax=Sulfurimonas sp. CS5 TaxID=3391145 RepID=UPI0039EA1FEC